MCHGIVQIKVIQILGLIVFVKGVAVALDVYAGGRDPDQRLRTIVEIMLTVLRKLVFISDDCVLASWSPNIC